MARDAAILRRLSRARELDAEIRARQGERNRLIVEIAGRLSELEPIVGALGYESVAAYAARTLGYSASKTRALVAIARGIEALPAVRTAAEAGEVPWTKLRHVVAVATAADEVEWLAKAKRLSSRKLEEAVASVRGEEMLETLRLELTAGQLADIDAGIARLIDSRDHGRCRVPGCGNTAFVERHHEGGWRRVGHDPKRAFLVCSRHHHARHEGALVVTFSADDEPMFSLADGTPLTDSSRETSSPVSDGCSTSHVLVSRETSLTAERALRRLGLSAEEAKRLLSRTDALATSDPAELVKLALKALPVAS